jgi:lipid II:glycine glycyltransferase (peptidoglycan interpeptide bridge formation enzyme)
MLEYNIKKKITNDELKEIEAFLNSIQFVTIEQYPEWSNVLDNKEQLSYLIVRNNNQIVLFCKINEYKILFLKFVQIFFGPVFENSAFLIESIEYLVNYYKQKGFQLIKIQLAIETGAETDLIEYKINQKYKIKYFFDRFNWASIRIKLKDKTEEEIFKEFSKGHRSSVKKTIKSNVQAVEINTEDDIYKLCEVYEKMNVQRRIPSDIQHTKKLFMNISKYLKEKEKGFILGVKNSSSEIIGGIIIVFQGNTARYYKGASDPDIRDIPVLHLAIWEAIKISKRMGRTYFDLWGYNHFVTEKDQVFWINRFKKGFGGEFLFYPKINNIELSKFGYIKTRIYLFIIQKLMKVKNYFYKKLNR